MDVFFVTRNVRIFGSSIQDEITNFRIKRNTNVKFVGFKLRQVVIFVFDENVDQNDTVVFTWVLNGIDVTYGAFTNMIRIICSMNLYYVVVSFLSEKIGKKFVKLLLEKTK